ncbi:hypothetical protein DNU06_05880 [Putridiphycobacter roseus]|uniref:GmrSD restriction endonucleases N-terminal domain-containing protein n=1 Tax=Putridiphycobacter roseus TaxID=2219161 RepID=A0A2W1NF84_9FLAO|nr:DUF262 domain-containing protein [Putridiphycobacter roseus]PZE18145.1 hypothetical protein DNU06_05880 [Putridiphycobacter roseus]
MSSKTNNIEEIEKKLKNGIFNLIQERNDFLLPQVLDFVQVKEWMNIQPEYQRRRVWDIKRKSQFIESLLMNVPIPPIFLLEWEYGRYEVMDGQQRLDAIISFYSNEFKLTGMKYWTELNGLSYNQFLPLVRRALDRRRISATTIMTESVVDDDDKLDLRRLVFERLNTGGMKLNSQEIRNCIYSGQFNDLIVDLSGNEIFTKAWNIPSHSDNISEGKITDKLSNNTLFRRMGDCEIVLRFYALFESKHLKGSLKTMMDGAMNRRLDITDDEIKVLRESFINSLELANEVFGEKMFQITDSTTGKSTQSINFYDAISVIFHDLRSKSAEILEKKEEIFELVQNLIAVPENYENLVNRRGSSTEISVMKAFFKNAIINLLD